MTRLAVVVEGRTKERFVKSVLGPHLIDVGIEAVPYLVGSGTRKVGGGDVHVDILTSDLIRTLDEFEFDAATSLVDFYGFRDREGRTAEQLESVILEEIMRERNNNPRVRPYIQMHEFEGLLFSNPEAFGVIGRRGARPDIARLRQIRCEFDTPEDINDSQDSAPSKQIENAVRGYRKIDDGFAVAKETGIERISEECPRFRRWLEWINGLAEDPAQ